MALGVHTTFGSFRMWFSIPVAILPLVTSS